MRKRILLLLPFPVFDLVADINPYKPPMFMYRALPSLSMITSRGCPGRCTFCACSMDKSYRKRLAQNIVAEIRHLVQIFQVRAIDFLDDNFLLDNQRIYRVFDRFRDEGIYIFWSCMARINSVDYEFLKYLRDNGCWTISYALNTPLDKSDLTRFSQYNPVFIPFGLTAELLLAKQRERCMSGSTSDRNRSSG